MVGPRSGTQILNGDKIRATLKALPAKIEKRILFKALGTESKKLLEAVQAATPVGEGDLRDSMQMKLAKRAEGTIGFSVGSGKVPAPRPNSGEWDAYYARMVEQGTIHMQPRPFMQPTFAALEQSIVHNITRELHDKLALALK